MNFSIRLLLWFVDVFLRFTGFENFAVAFAKKKSEYSFFQAQS
jgi:hypothetical protein